MIDARLRGADSCMVGRRSAGPVHPSYHAPHGASYGGAAGERGRGVEGTGPDPPPLDPGCV